MEELCVYLIIGISKGLIIAGIVVLKCISKKRKEGTPIYDEKEK